MKPKIIINKQNIIIIKGGKIITLDYNPDSVELIKEHLQLTTMTESKTSATYVVSGGPLAQTIKVLETRQSELNKPDLPPEYLEALEKLTSGTTTNRFPKSLTSETESGDDKHNKKSSE